MVEKIWRDLLFLTHATSVGAITSLALAAIDTALWDLRCRKAGLPLHVMAGGARDKVELYTTEGGWLHLPTEALVADALEAKADGFGGSKIKVGRPAGEDVARLAAMRAAVGADFEIFTDANQAFTVDEAIRRARLYEAADIGWFEEPLPADDVDGHARLSRATTIPIAVGESLYSPSQFRDYLQRGACSIVQVDVARIGGITPWLKTAHLAETFNVRVCPHFLMELHVALCCAVPNARWLEYIPQLDDITAERMTIRRGLRPAERVAGTGDRLEFRGDRTLDRRGEPSTSGQERLTGGGMRRMGLCNRLRPEKVEEYKALHAAAWPDVLACITACNIRNFSIFLRTPENLLFAYWEYHGEDFEADARKMAADPVTRQWWALTDPCQEPYETREEGAWWASMEEVFYHP